MSAPRTPLPRRRFFGRMLAALAASAWAGRLFGPREAHAGSDQEFVGEIRMFAGATPPDGWAFCQGQLLPIEPYIALFSLMGTTYGGDGTTNFALPDLRGRAPMHFGDYFGTDFSLGEASGSESHPLISTEMPSHSHSLAASGALGTSPDPAGRVPARNAAGVPVYSPASFTGLAPAALTSSGGSVAHPNLQPYLAIQFIIALDGIYPSRS